MAEVVLFHHVQGLSDGISAFADELRAGGHTVHAPDLFDGERPATIDNGIAHTQSIGGDVLDERADLAVAELPEGLVYAGFSFGAGTAQRLAQTRRGAARCCTNPASRSPGIGQPAPPPALRPGSSATPASPASSPANRMTVSPSLPPVSHASTATMIGTEAISRPLRELG